MLDIAQINNPHETRVKINELRNVILSDAYLQEIPSVQTKTKYFFHAKDDCPEVRRDFYKLIASLAAKVYCIIRRKSQILKTVLNDNKYYNGWKYNQNKIYDSCVKRIFKDRLHSVEKNQITFARRGKSDRNKILTQELNKAAANFEKTFKKVACVQLVLFDKRHCKKNFIDRSEKPLKFVLFSRIWNVYDP